MKFLPTCWLAYSTLFQNLASTKFIFSFSRMWFSWVSPEVHGNFSFDNSQFPLVQFQLAFSQIFLLQLVL